jgi:hypothetical protein
VRCVRCDLRDDAQTLATAKKVNEADEALSRLWRVASDCTPGRLLAAQMYCDEGSLEACIRESGRVLKFEPGNVQALILRGNAHFSLEVRGCTCHYLPWE